MQKKYKAFTLIELLIVIAIITVIAALLFPVFASIRERGRRTQCLSNERQVGMAMMQYANDNDETFPFNSLTPISGIGWAGSCLLYTKDVAILSCPSDSQNGKDDPYNKIVSYAINSNLGGYHIHPNYPKSPQTTTIFAQSLAALFSPANTVLTFEVSDCLVNFTAVPAEVSSPAGNGVGSAYPYSSGGQFLVDDVGYVLYATGDIGDRVLNGGTKSIPRHNKGTNYLSCDGHVKWFTPSTVSSGTSASGSTCLQGTDANQPIACQGQQRDQAAGTASGKYNLTFSTK